MDKILSTTDKMTDTLVETHGRHGNFTQTQGRHRAEKLAFGKTKRNMMFDCTGGHSIVYKSFDENQNRGRRRPVLVENHGRHGLSTDDLVENLDFA